MKQIKLGDKKKNKRRKTTNVQKTKSGFQFENVILKFLVQVQPNQSKPKQMKLNCQCIEPYT